MLESWHWCFVCDKVTAGKLFSLRANRPGNTSYIVIRAVVVVVVEGEGEGFSQY